MVHLNSVKFQFTLNQCKSTLFWCRHNTARFTVHMAYQRNGLKNSSSYEPTCEKGLEIDAEKIKVKVYTDID